MRRRQPEELSPEARIAPPDEPGRCTYYVDSIHLADDPRLDGRLEEHAEGGRGGSGLTHPRQDADGVWRVERDIVLGREIPGHPGFPDDDGGK